MKKLLGVFFIMGLFFSCTEELPDLDENMDDYFFVKHNGAVMPVLVEGNIESKKFIIIVHGGPGGSSFSYNYNDVFNKLEEDFALVYYDQRGTVAAYLEEDQDSYSRQEYAEDINEIIKVLKLKYGSDNSFYLLGHSWGGELSTQFMVTPEFQKNISAWINVGGGQIISDDSWEREYKYVRDSLISFAEVEIQEGENVQLWQEIYDFCIDINKDNYSNSSEQLSDYQYDFTWEYIHEEGKIIYETIDGIIGDDGPSFYSGGNSTFAQLVTGRDNQLPDFPNITKPTLIIYGRYDLICPPQGGQLLYDNISTQLADKQICFVDSAEHEPYFRANYFYDLVKPFINKY